jgi:hypothetical protein
VDGPAPWWTNAPYFVLAVCVISRALPVGLVAAPWAECLRPFCSSDAIHAVCVLLIAVASSAFHGVQLGKAWSLTA